MSFTRMYAIALTARSKLGREADRADHNLRRLVGHANLLDALLIDLAVAERDQESRFNLSFTKAALPESRRIQWSDWILEDSDDDDSDLDSDDDDSCLYSDDESDDGSIYSETAGMLSAPVRPVCVAPVVTESQETGLSDEEDDVGFDESIDEHVFVRILSQHLSPEVALNGSDSNSDSRDETLPASPNQHTMERRKKEKQQPSDVFYNNRLQVNSVEGYVIYEPQPPLISAC